MKKLFSILVFAATMLAACITDITEDVGIATPETITVSFEEDSRIQLAEGKTVWTAGDKVSVFYKSDSNDCYDFMGKTGDRKGLLMRGERGEATTTTDEIVVVYPYNENYTLSPENKTIGVTIPAVQYYENSSYGVGSNIMISTSTTDKLFLKSLCGWIKLQLTGDDKVESITVKSNNNEQIAGKAVANYQDYTLKLLADCIADGDDTEVGGLLTNETDYVREVTLDLGEGVQLSETPTDFYISLAPQRLADGFTLTVNFANGTQMVKSTDSEIVISRNAIQPMDTMPVEQEQPANNEIWYTSSDNEVVTPKFTDVFGATIVSNEYDAAKECFVITFDGEVTSIGNYAFQYCSSLTSVTIPDGVTSIGEWAFYYCRSLSSVTIPNSVTSIGDYAFRSCSSLASVTIPDSVTSIGNYAFYICSSLASVIIPDSVTSIEKNTFSNCSSLTSVTIPNSVTSIGQDAFYNCSSLTSVTIPDSVTTLGSNPFENCSNLAEFNGKFASADKRCLIVDGVLKSFAPAGLTEYTIPDSVTSIGGSAFGYCSSLTSVTIPDSVTSIGFGAFSDCSSLISVTIDNSVTSIGERAFSNCSSLASITIPNSVTSIGDYAFYKCSSLASVTIPDSVTSIGEFAFNKCSSLTSVTIGDSVTSIGDGAFSDCYRLDEFNGKFASADKRCLIVDGELKSFAVGCELTEYTIPNSVTSIGNYAFCICSSLTSVTIPDSVTSIGNYAFNDCSSLASVTIPDSVTSIGEFAFNDCSSLTSVSIPDSVTSIGSYAFVDCSSLKSVYCKPTTPPTGGSGMFSLNASGRKIYVPASDDDSIINAYKAAQYWSHFYAADIEEYDFND